MRFDPSGPLHGELRPPPDKSVTHRAALIGAMADGPTRITGYLDSEDTRATLRAVASVGAEVREGDADEHGGIFVEIEGVGLRGPRPAEIDVGNAGTLLRIMPGWLAGQAGGEWTFDGDESIRRRPVDRIADPLRLMGAEVDCRDDRLPPLRVRGSQLRGIDYEMPVASAQVKSCLLLAGLLAEGETSIHEPIWTRDHTERMLAAMGASIRREGERLIVAPAERLEAGDFPVPGDFSSAAFFIAAALLVPGSEIGVREVGINRNRIGLLSILSRMGVEMDGAHEAGQAMTVREIREPGPEPIATLQVRSAPLGGATVTAEDVPAAIDELPLVALLGCFAEGETVVGGASELRAKESDRIAGVVEGLSGLGAEIEARPDGFAVQGTGGLRGGVLDARGDHRLAMVGAIAGLASEEGVEVEGFEAVAVSYPGFERDLRALTT
ncbi:MAG TPA: 3-phosphoshikimate 1-carboxyvinyltransferase [Solirubrobacterales bacterium]|jgi:3-phosphoshikimate 1-carboxyvinyltransferase|nr:3-phosphoshikimate 1-carboxyvinyltransferase [Solirubrobacterales bacterium]